MPKAEVVDAIIKKGMAVNVQCRYSIVQNILKHHGIENSKHAYFYYSGD